MMAAIIQISKEIKIDQEENDEKIFLTGDRVAKRPPFVTTEFVAKDNGNVNPKLMRSSMYALPKSLRTYKEYNIPLTLCVQPFTQLDLDGGELGPELVYQTSNGPVSCKSCGAFINKKTTFDETWTNFSCGICYSGTPVDPEYTQGVVQWNEDHPSQVRADLAKGAYEVQISPYQKPTPLFVFLVDVSIKSREFEVPEGVIQALQNVLEDLERIVKENQRKPKVALMFYDNHVHFMDCRREGLNFLTVPDYDEPFVPFFDGICMEPEEMKERLKRHLTEILQVFKKPDGEKEEEGILGPPLEFALELFKPENRCGKILLYIASLPNNKEVRGNLNDKHCLEKTFDKDNFVFTPSTPYYKDLAKKCVAQGVGVDIFFLTQEYINNETVADLAIETGGTLYIYIQYTTYVDGKYVTADTINSVCKQIGFEVEVKFRHEESFSLTYTHGVPPYQRSATIVGTATALAEHCIVHTNHFGVLNTGSCLQYELSINNDLIGHFPFQASVEYTNLKGERVVRVMNLMLESSDNHEELLSGMEWSVITSHHLKLTLQRVQEKWSASNCSFMNIRNLCYSIAAMRRRTNVAKHLLYIPHSLKCWSLGQHAIMHSFSLFPKYSKNEEEAVFYHKIVPTLGPAEAMNFLVPNVIQLDERHWQNGETLTQHNQVEAADDNLSNREIFLLDNFFMLNVIVGQNVSEKDMEEHIGLRRGDWQVAYVLEMMKPDSIIAKVLEQRRARKSHIGQLKIYFGTNFVSKFFVCDQNGDQKSYAKFLREVHNNVFMLVN